ncbi:Retrovirus-related Pol polyprotein from transposon 17.6, partial [Mucuna pruriens]
VEDLSFNIIEPTGVIIQLVNRSIVHPLGILEDVLVQIHELIFLVDFYVLDMKNKTSSKGSTLILGRSFLITTRIKIDMYPGTLSMEFDVADVSILLIWLTLSALVMKIRVAIDVGPEVVEVAASEPPSPSIMQPPTLKLKPLPEHLKYAYLEDDQKLPDIIGGGSSTSEVATKAADPTILDVVSLVQVVPKKSRMTVVKNQNDELVPTRIQNNYKKLNQTTRKNHFPLPFINQVLERLVDHLRFPIWHISLHKDATRHIQCPKHLPKRVAWRPLWTIFMVYSHSFDECLESLFRVLDRCIETNLVLNFEKCHFMVTKGIVLGHLVSNRGIEVDKDKIDIIASFSHPTSVREPCIEAFQELKKRLTTTPILQAPDCELPFELMCDASNLELGVVFGQRIGKLSHVIAYASCTMDSAQANYTTTKKELLAIIFALDKFCSYLLGSKFFVFTDHVYLKFLLKKLDAKPRLIR